MRVESTIRTDCDHILCIHSYARCPSVYGTAIRRLLSITLLMFPVAKPVLFSCVCRCDGNTPRFCDDEAQDQTYHPKRLPCSVC